MKKLAIAAAIPVIVLAASAFTFAPAASAATAGTPTVVSTGTIHLTKMGLYLNDRGNSSTKGAVVQVWAPNGGAAEVWQVMSDGTIRHNGLCLDAVGAGKTNGTKIDLWVCGAGKSNQQWNTKNWRVTNPVSGLVVNDAGYGGNGTHQVLWTNTGTSNEIWAVVATPKPTPITITAGPVQFTQGAPGYEVVEMDSNPITGPVGLTWTDIDTNINGVRAADNGPANFGPLQANPSGAGNEFAAGYLVLAPGTYTLTLDMRNGATVLATSAPVNLIVP